MLEGLKDLGMKLGVISNTASLYQVFDILKEYGIRALTSCRVARIGEGEAILCTPGHAEEHLPCSCIVLATGYRPRTALAEALRGMDMPVYGIGDCHGGTRICDAVWQATATAETI